MDPTNEEILRFMQEWLDINDRKLAARYDRMIQAIDSCLTTGGATPSSSTSAESDVCGVAEVPTPVSPNTISEVPTPASSGSDAKLVTIHIDGPAAPTRTTRLTRDPSRDTTDSRSAPAPTTAPTVLMATVDIVPVLAAPAATDSTLDGQAISGVPSTPANCSMVCLARNPVAVPLLVASSILALPECILDTNTTLVAAVPLATMGEFPAVLAPTAFTPMSQMQQLYIGSKIFMPTSGHLIASKVPRPMPWPCFMGVHVDGVGSQPWPWPSFGEIGCEFPSNSVEKTVGLCISDSSNAKEPEHYFYSCQPRESPILNSVRWSVSSHNHPNGDDTRPLPWPSFMEDYGCKAPSVTIMKPSQWCSSNSSRAESWTALEFQILKFYCDEWLLQLRNSGQQDVSYNQLSGANCYASFPGYFLTGGQIQVSDACSIWQTFLSASSASLLLAKFLVQAHELAGILLYVSMWVEVKVIGRFHEIESWWNYMLHGSISWRLEMAMGWETTVLACFENGQDNLHLPMLTWVSEQEALSSGFQHQRYMPICLVQLQGFFFCDAQTIRSINGAPPMSIVLDDWYLHSHIMLAAVLLLYSIKHPLLGDKWRLQFLDVRTVYAVFLAVVLDFGSSSRTRGALQVISSELLVFIGLPKKISSSSDSTSHESHKLVLYNSGSYMVQQYTDLSYFGIQAGLHSGKSISRAPMQGISRGNKGSYRFNAIVLSYMGFPTLFAPIHAECTTTSIWDASYSKKIELCILARELLHLQEDIHSSIHLENMPYAGHALLAHGFVLMQTLLFLAFDRQLVFQGGRSAIIFIIRYLAYDNYVDNLDYLDFDGLKVLQVPKNPSVCNVALYAAFPEVQLHIPWDPGRLGASVLRLRLGVKPCFKEGGVSGTLLYSAWAWAWTMLEQATWAWALPSATTGTTSTVHTATRRQSRRIRTDGSLLDPLLSRPCSLASSSSNLLLLPT